MPCHDHAGPPPPAAPARPVPGPRRPAAQPGVPLELSHAQMNAACDSGLAVSFGQAIGWIARHGAAWWVLYEHGWLRITDQETTADLDQASAQLSQADAALARTGAIRAAVTSQSAAEKFLERAVSRTWEPPPIPGQQHLALRQPVTLGRC